MQTGANDGGYPAPDSIDNVQEQLRIRIGDANVCN